MVTFRIFEQDKISKSQFKTLIKGEDRDFTLIVTMCISIIYII